MLAQAQEPKTSVREMVTVSGTVERADRSTRTLTLRTSPSTTQIISVAPEVKLFDELQTGDKITVRLSESVIAAVRPGVKPSVAVDTTATATPRDPSQRSEVLQQVKAAVTVESVDRQQNLIVYKTADNRRVIRAVIDPRLLDGLKAGDVVEITYTRERAVDLQRAR
jgi:arginine repressor